jgi:hypothetical protein
MSQEPSLTTRYEQPRVPVYPLGFDRGNVVSVQLSDPLHDSPPTQKPSSTVVCSSFQLGALAHRG